jgi:hypothetical protein
MGVFFGVLFFFGSAGFAFYVSESQKAGHHAAVP